MGMGKPFKIFLALAIFPPVRKVNCKLGHTMIYRTCVLEGRNNHCAGKFGKRSGGSWKTLFPNVSKILSSRWIRSPRPPLVILFSYMFAKCEFTELATSYPKSPNKYDLYQQTPILLPIFPAQWLTRKAPTAGRPKPCLPHYSTS